VILTKSLIILIRWGELGDIRYKWRDFDRLSNFANWGTLVFEGLNILGATRERPEASYWEVWTGPWLPRVGVVTSLIWVEVLAACSSDHMPICLHLLTSHQPIHKIHSFKYEACWDIDTECAEVVKTVWGVDTGATPGGDEMKQLLGKCQQALEDWSSNKYRAMGLSVKRLTRRLEVLQRSEHPSNLATIAELQQEIDQLLEMEDT
jgi:hypothetical protein